MYSSEIEFPNKKIETIMKAPAGMHIIAEVNEITGKSEVVGKPFDNWLDAHAEVDRLNKNRKDDKTYAVYNDQGKKTRCHEDVGAEPHPLKN